MKQNLKTALKHPLSFLLRIFILLSAAITMGVLLYIIIFIVAKGAPHLSLDLFAWEYTSDNVSMMPAIINTLIMTGLSLVIAVPLGIFAAIYLVEYAKRGSKLVKVIRMTAETLSGIPSHYLWSVWSSFLCNLFALGILYVVRGIDLSYYDLATCYSYD